MARALRVIAGTAGGLHLVAPKSGLARPTTDRVKESLFSALGPDRVVGATVLDLYAGSGALGIEALSRGAATALFVDRDRDAQSAIRRNLTSTGLAARGRVRRSSVLSFLAHAADEGPFDLVFVDPPYELGVAEIARVFDELSQPGALASGAAVVLERSTRDGEPDLAGWQIGWRRAYGDTLLVVATR
jgi:16S rRNA (guanine966-N2)-methyltransferase